MNLIVENVAFERNNYFLFEKINFSLQAGELIQLRGANGSGKSTLLRILAGFIEPQMGTVICDNQSIFEQLDHYQQQLHYVGHQNGIKPNLTVFENLRLSCALAMIKTADIEKVVERVGLASLLHKPALQLSAGQSRRLSLARLLLNQIPLWILDEPTTALDADGQKLLTELLNEHLSAKGSAIVATHQHLNLTREMQIIQLGEHHAQ